MNRLKLWAPAALLMLGAGMTTGGAQSQKTVPLLAPLGSAIPEEIAGHRGRDLKLSAEEARVAGFTDYLMRVYERPQAAEAGYAFSLYVGYYASQSRGNTIHSPRNCLPGAGWDALASRRETIPTAAGDLTVNRYLLQRGQERVLVLYWYQGRGRTEADEYRVKWDLLRDAAVRGRTDEALVRVIVPIEGEEEEAFRLAARVAAEASERLEVSLPS